MPVRRQRNSHAYNPIETILPVSGDYNLCPCVWPEIDDLQDELLLYNNPDAESQSTADELVRAVSVLPRYGDKLSCFLFALEFEYKVYQTSNSL